MSEDQKAMVPGDPQPTSAAEYLARFKRNQRISGYGFNVTMHYPCPFCAAPDFKVERVVDTEKNAGKENVCRECGRGMAIVLTKTEDGSTSYISMRQTRGPDQPDWLEPKMPRAALDPVVATIPKTAEAPVQCRPTVAHRGSPRIPGSPIEYNTRGGVENVLCSYCGSAHPEDVAEAIRQGARLERADMKYGWPHKAYIHEVPESMKSKRLLKFYTEHLQDAAPADKDVIERALGLRFEFTDDRVMWTRYE